MDVFVTTDYPEVSKKEMKELIKKESKIYSNLCFVKDISERDLAKLCYEMQSVKKVCVSVFNCSSKNLENNIKNLDIDKTMLKEITSFEVRSESHSEIFTSPKLNTFIGLEIQKNTDLDVNLNSPNLTFYVVLEKDLFIGIDVVGFDLSKRPYKISNQSDSINSSFAYSLLRIAGVKKNSTVVDPFAGSGTIPIECTLFQSNISAFKFENKFNGFKIPFLKKYFIDEENIQKEKKVQTKGKVYAYDHLLKHVLGIQKNAKLAGVEKIMSMSKISIDWVDSKLDETSVDFIITDPPKYTLKLDNLKDITKIYDELFYQSKYVLKKTGKMGVLVLEENILLKEAKKHKFELVEIINLKRGEMNYKFLIFKKGI